MKSWKVVDVIVAALLVLGGINWGLVGLFNFNLLGEIFGGAPFILRLLYTIVGLCALYELILWRSLKERWHCTGTIRAHVEA